jgi:two-component system sensor histidine kinase KdpD
MHAGSRGKLKIFLGAAPGVGKTFAMLAAARIQKQHNIDVVLALVETHGRTETEALLAGLESMPRADVEYRGHLLKEMDLDGVLARRPQLALVDELAHSNIPGSRHDKRYLDIEELLAAGIDVFTTCNVQHVESLNDAVAQITGVRVHETVPDSFFEKADEVEVVDLSVDDLLQRLDEGKVYVPHMAEQAVRHFFRAGNLTALRELALRLAAQRVAGQMHTYMQAHAIPGPWPTNERLLVCISPSPLSPRLVRTAKRMSDRRHCEFVAVYVETPGHYHLSATDRDRVAANLRLAEQLGGQTATLPADRPAQALVEYARDHNVTEIIVGKSHRAPWKETLFGSFILDVIHHAGDIDVYVVTGTDGQRVTPPPPRRRRPLALPTRDMLKSAAAVTVSGLLVFVLHAGLGLAVSKLSMVFLLAVLYSATTAGLWPSVVTAGLCLFAYDFFFVPPILTFTVAKHEDLLALIVYLAVAVFTSRLTARARDQAEAAKRREGRMAALYALSREISVARGVSEVLSAVVKQVHASLGADVAVLLPEQGMMAQAAAQPPDAKLSDQERAAATLAWQKDQPAGRGSDTLPGIHWYCLPLRTARSRPGVLAVRFDGQATLDPDQRRLLEAFGGQAAVAIERTRFVEL